MKISMKIAPDRTNTAKFQGFGLKSSSSSSSTLPPARTAAAKAKAATGGATALFRESLDDDDGPKVAAVPQWSKPPIEAIQAQRQAEALQAENPSIFEYDEVIDDVKRDLDIELPSQQVRTEALEQKKRVGLTVREGSEAVKVGTQRQSRYAEKVINTIERRKVEQQIIEDRMLKKEQDAREGREVFVTGAFKEELKRRKKFEEELEAQELRDQRRDATKMENNMGFADFHRSLLNGGLASSRGSATITDVSGPRTDLEEEEEAVKKEEVKEEEEDEKKDIKLEKEEDGESKEPGVLDAQTVAPTSEKAAKEAAESENRAEKAMSAKERYLARKRAAAEMSTDA